MSLIPNLSFAREESTAHSPYLVRPTPRLYKEEPFFVTFPLPALFLGVAGLAEGLPLGVTLAVVNFASDKKC